MRRREFITLLGGVAVAWPLAARAQQPAMPLIGFLTPERPKRLLTGCADFVRVSRRRVSSKARTSQSSIAMPRIELERLPELVADLVRRRVTLLVTGGGPAAFAAKAATTTIPVVFLIGDDPVRLGLVASLARPESNLTGINILIVESATKRLELLHALVPGATRIVVLVNQADPSPKIS